MKISDYGLEIIRIGNGYKLRSPNDEGTEWGEEVIEDDPADQGNVNMRSAEELLWNVIDYFCLGGSKHDKERIRIVREKQK